MLAHETENPNIFTGNPPRWHWLIWLDNDFIWQLSITGAQDAALWLHKWLEAKPAQLQNNAAHTGPCWTSLFYILGLLNDVQWPEESGDLRRGHRVHRKLLTSGTQRKHPSKHADESVNRKIHKGRHLVQVHDAFRDPKTHSSSVWCFLYWHTVFPCFRMSCVRADCIHHQVTLVYSK